LIRKKGKLPGITISRKYQLEYGEAEIEVHEADIPKGKRVLVVDDLIATGGTLKAATDLVVAAGAQVAGIFGVVGLPFLNYRSMLGGIPIKTLIEYHDE
ncbi:MAG: phosphoribosyltransferase family protein, partial [Treponemataceae bacterium]